MKAHIRIHVDGFHTEISIQDQLPEPQHFIINNNLKKRVDSIILLRVKN
jgi:hypothetical protein